MFDEMTDRGFVDFLAALWESRGWETGVQEDEPGVYMITGDRETGQRGLLLVVPATNATVPGKPVQTVASICDAKNVDVGVVATRGGFSDDAERIAEANDVHLLDQPALEKTVAAEGLEDLVEEYSSDGVGSLLDRLPIPSLRSPSPPGIPTRGLTTLLVVAAVVAIGLVGAQHFGVLPDLTAQVPGFVPSFGVGGGGGFTVTAASLTAGNGSAVDVAWNADVQSQVTTQEGKTFTAPDGETFVVVQMNVTNHRSDPVIFRSRSLAFAANNTRHGPRHLKGALGQPPAQIPPGNSTSLWVVFSVDRDVDSGTLLGLPGTDAPPIQFHRDRELPMQVAAG